MQVKDPDIDAGRRADWGRTSGDYARHRPGPPAQFYDILATLGIGLPGQRMADLATGTGLLAREFARRGASVDGVDIAAGQVEVARSLAGGLDARFSVAPAEETGLDAGVFDAVTANQCWLYFDNARAAAEVSRLLRPGGRLVISHFSFQPRLSRIVAASEALVLRHNPDWSGADWAGGWENYAPPPGFRRTGAIAFDVMMPFTREDWRGRMRALRGIGASLDAGAVAEFDAAHAALLERIAPERFDVPHRVEASLFVVA